MKKLRWFQTKVGLFQDPRMMYLLSQPSGDSYFVIWFYLKDLAGMVNDDGYIYVAKGQAVTTALLARQLHRRRAFVEKGPRRVRANRPHQSRRDGPDPHRAMA